MKDDPDALARFFVVTIQGMRAMARLKTDRKPSNKRRRSHSQYSTPRKGEGQAWCNNAFRG